MRDATPSACSSPSHETSLVSRWVIADSQPLGLNDPKRRLDRLRSQRPDRAIETLKYGANRLVPRSQNDHAGRATGVVSPSVREVCVEGDENPLIAFTYSLDHVVDCRSETLVVDVAHIPATCLETRARKTRHVLVEQKPHRLCRNRHYPLVGELRRERERGGNVLWAQARVLLEDRLCAPSVGQIIEDDIDGNACAPHARRTMHPFGVNPNVFTPVHVRLLSSGHRESKQRLARGVSVRATGH